MENLLTKVKTKLFIPSNKKALSVLEGMYRAVFVGLGNDFVDLREYYHGDPVKNIDWKSSARGQGVMVKQFEQTKRIPTCFVVDTGLSMRASTGFGDELRVNNMVTVVGMLGYLSVKNGGAVRAVYGDSVESFVKKNITRESDLNIFLNTLTDRVLNNNVAVSNILVQLNFFAETVPDRCNVIVVSGLNQVTPEIFAALKMVTRRHTVFWVNTVDSDPTAIFAATSSDEVSDIETGENIPAYIRKHKTLLNTFLSTVQSQQVSLKENFGQLGVKHVAVWCSDVAVTQLIKMLAPIGKVR
jgi:uncharacterized protein (DUF58 family)